MVAVRDNETTAAAYTVGATRQKLLAASIEVFGRLGCTLVHDHVGSRSEFLLAIRFPDGARHDLGLYELLYTVAVLVPAVVRSTTTRPWRSSASASCSRSSAAW